MAIVGLALARVAIPSPPDGWRVADPPQQTDIRMSIAGNGRNLQGYLVEIVLEEGGKPVRVLLDTGATGLLLARDLMPKSVKAVGLARVQGVGDQAAIRRIPAARIASVRIGELEFRDAVVLLAERELLAGFDGILGADVFADFLVTLDFPEQKILLERREATAEEGFRPLQRQGHELLVRSRVNGREGLLLQIDSGANISLLDENVARRSALVTEDLYARVQGATGSASRVWRVDHAQVEVGGLRRSPRRLLAISFANQNSRRPVAIDGILGLPELRDLRLSIDYGRGLIKFEK